MKLVKVSEYPNFLIILHKNSLSTLPNAFCWDYVGLNIFGYTMRYNFTNCKEVREYGPVPYTAGFVPLACSSIGLSLFQIILVRIL